MSQITQSDTLSTTNSSLLHGSDTGSSSGTSRSPSPRRSYTAPASEGSSNRHIKPRTPKRIVVLCDGTWEDGIRSQQRSSYTNVLRFARSIHHEDTKNEKAPPIPQVVFYQSGIGSGNNLYSEYVEGTTGSTLPDKVEDAYAFIAQNFNEGDEICLFGFSRGAYTARMIATFIGEIGVLKRQDMDHFGTIFLNFKKLGLSNDKKEMETIKAYLQQWRDPNSEGHKRALYGQKKFTVKCLCVWDTVGSLGLPDEIPHLPKERQRLFGFQDCVLGPHIEHAYQALAINELRKDFTCNKFHQTQAGKAKGQVLKQTWFSGCHADIGGGYPDHDLADLTLVWMAANVGQIIHIDEEYLIDVIRPAAPWGTQMPHDSREGVFLLTFEAQRPLPEAPNPETNETVHPSVLRQIDLRPNSVLRKLAQSIETHPTLVPELMPLEEAFRDKYWLIAHEQMQAYAERLQQKRTLTPDVVVRQVDTAQLRLVVTSTDTDTGAGGTMLTTTTTTQTASQVRRTAQIQAQGTRQGTMTSGTVGKTQTQRKRKTEGTGAGLTTETKTSSWFSSFVRSMSGNSLTLTPRSKSRKSLSISVNAQAALAADVEGLDTGVRLGDAGEGEEDSAGTARRDLSSAIVCGR